MERLHEEERRFYFNVKSSYRSYKKVFLPDENVVAIHRRYCAAKSFPLKRCVISISHPAKGPPSPHVGVLYRASDSINECPTLPHGNAKRKRPYFRTSGEVLTKAKQTVTEGIPMKKIYDKINNESGGIFNCDSQSKKIRNMRQIYRQKEKDPNNNENKDQITHLIGLQQENPDFIRSVCCLPKSYYTFITNDIQLDDVDKFCCKHTSVLSIDTTFNLCDNWLTDTCYPNNRLVNSNGNHPFFLGPAVLHFDKSSFTFHRFIKEMCSFNPAIKELKKVGTDLERAIYNGFSTEIPDLRLLLCVFHLKNLRKRS